MDSAHPETFMFFVKTNKAMHQGGFVFLSLDEFHEAKDNLKTEVDHVVTSAQQSDPDVVLESWGVTSSTTGEIAEQIDA